MPKTEISIPNLQQCKVFQITPTEIEIRIKQHNYPAGYMNLTDKIFYHFKRTRKNIFHKFNGLGVNAELLSIVLPHFGVNKIVMPFEDQLFETTVNNWLMNGILSPYCDQSVDKQLILPFAIMIPNATGNDPEKVENNQLSLFN